MIFNFTYSQLTPRYKWYGANDVEDFNEISRTLVFQSTSDFLGTKSGTKSIQLSLVLLLDSSHTSYLSVSQPVSQLGTVRNGLPANLPEPGLEKPNKAGREVGTRCSVGEGGIRVYPKNTVSQIAPWKVNFRCNYCRKKMCKVWPASG